MFRLSALILWLSLLPMSASAFCGFYVARADSDLFNEASKVVYMRDGTRSVITMASDYFGEPADFAMVVPTPSVLERGQINVTDKATVDHLDAYTAPRLVEYFDPDPCALQVRRLTTTAEGIPNPVRPSSTRTEALGVTVEAQYAVGEYDIVILSANQSDGLETWLVESGYKIPEGAAKALAPYISAGMKFFVAKVNLEAHNRRGGGFLRPLQIAFDSPDFMLPIRLGMLNSRGKQDLLLFTLTRTGQVETANYLTEKMPTGMEIPIFVKDEFADFYKTMFAREVDKRGGSTVLMEYAWDMAWCDPCAADPLTGDELRSLGAFWVPRDGARVRNATPANVFVTRLHARYDDKGFPNDLMLRETGNRDNFQGRYILRHPWTGNATCKAAEDYLRALPKRLESEAQTLARLTGWDIDEIRGKIPTPVNSQSSQPWWQEMWKDR